MLVNVDAKAIEWVVAAFLSQDEVAINEIILGVDQHNDNQTRFKLPSRLIAKTFVFRLIYGGQAYSYANDFNFMSVSSSERFWQKVIDAFYEKYKGLEDWHTRILQNTRETGSLEIPSGRIFEFNPEVTPFGDLKWPRTTILNYPVQGLAADIMSIIRVSFYTLWKKEKIDGYLVSTVHDSIIVDINPKELHKVAALFFQVFNDLPKNFSNYFGVDFNLPTRCEISYGKNLKDLTEIKKTDILLV